MSKHNLEIELGSIILLPPERLTPMSNQPRKEFDAETVRGIAESVISLRARGLGHLRTGYTDVLTVRLSSGALDKNGHLKDDVKLPIVSGETRWRAALWANERQSHAIPELPCAIENVNDEDALELAYFANAHRKDLSALDEAQFLLLWKNRQNLTLRTLANKTGKTLGYIQNRMDVIGASPDVLSIFDTRPKALMIVRRIDTVKDPPFRKELIKQAKNGATHAAIEERIKAHNYGVSVEEVQARREAAGYERQYEKEARAAQRSSLLEELDVTTMMTDVLSLAKETRMAMRGSSFTSAQRRTLSALIKELKIEVEGLNQTVQSKN